MLIKLDLGAKTASSSCNCGLCSNTRISVRIKTKSRGGEFKQNSQCLTPWFGVNAQCFLSFLNGGERTSKWAGCGLFWGCRWGRCWGLRTWTLAVLAAFAVLLLEGSDGGGLDGVFYYGAPGLVLLSLIFIFLFGLDLICERGAFE